MARDTFAFYRSFYEAIKDLPDAIRVSIYDAVCEYALDDKDVDLDGISKSIFTLIKPQLDATASRYNASVENGKKGGDYGKLGGRPTKKKPLETPRKPLKGLSTKPLENPLGGLNAKPLNDNDNVNDNVNVHDNTPPYNPPEGEGVRSGVGVSTGLFNLFWSAYPKKVGNAEATNWFETHRPDKTLVDQMLTAIEQQRKSIQWTKDNGQYIPQPINWLKRKEWLNVLPVAATKQEDTNPYSPSKVEAMIEQDFENAWMEQDPTMKIQEVQDAEH